MDLLSRDLAVKTVVKGSYIIMQNKAVSMDRLYYPASIVTPEGYQRILPSGMNVWVMLNMFDDQHLYIIDDKGRCLGMSTLQQRAPYYDEDQVRAAMGRKKKATAAALQTTRANHARKEAAIIGTPVQPPDNAGHPHDGERTVERRRHGRRRPGSSEETARDQPIAGSESAGSNTSQERESPEDFIFVINNQ